MTDFSRARFSGEADFREATHKVGATFRGANFEKKAIFHGANFEGITSFFDSTFKGQAHFSVVNFEEVSFEDAAFKERAYFDRAAFKQETYFRGFETFSHGADFQFARIDKPELFSFHRVRLRPSWFINVDPREFDFTDVQWPGQPDGPKVTLGDEYWSLRDRNIHLSYNPYALLSQVCRRLSAHAEDNREYPLANEFHYWSMDALRKQGWRSLGLIGILYWALSGYGVRAARAWWVLVAMWAAFTVLYVLVEPSEFKEFGQGIRYLWQAAVYSLLALVRLNPEPRPEESGVFQFLVGLEGILGPLQIALLALAIRRKVMR